MQPFRAKSTVSTSGNGEIGPQKKKDEQFGSLANFQFSTSAMRFSEFDTVSCRTPEHEGLVPMKAYTLR